MSNAACAMAPMVEARRDGRLGEREARSLDRHLAHCLVCRALARDLEVLAALVRRPLAPPLPSVEHRRRRATLLLAACGMARSL